MQHQQMLLFFQYQRQIFGMCPCCGDFFRLSDCKVYKEDKAPTDWLDKLVKEDRKLDAKELVIEEKLEILKQASKDKARKEANKLVNKIDTVFGPQQLNPDDAKVIFHPIDFVVFNGMKAEKNGAALENIVLLDSKKQNTEAKKIQKSVMKAVHKEKYEWLTLRVNNDGTIKEE